MKHGKTKHAKGFFNSDLEEKVSQGEEHVLTIALHQGAT
jgi:hypothetical protein